MIERYDMSVSYGQPEMVECANGNYVLYDDYEGIRSKYAGSMIDQLVTLLESKSDDGTPYMYYLKQIDPETHNKLVKLIKGLV